MPPHGDLRQRLIQAGLTLLDEEGAEGLTLRRIAARAGVSHAAPTHHFGGMPGLRVAIAAQGFRDFYAVLDKSRDSLPADVDPFKRLLTISLTYIDFASRRTALFRLMFDQLPTYDVELQEIARATHVILRECCAPFRGDRETGLIETAIWAMAHGFAMLKLDRPYPPGSPVQVSSYEETLRLLVR